MLYKYENLFVLSCSGRVSSLLNLGVYVRYDNEKARKEFRGIGMRIEDDILIRSDGVVEVLTRGAVRDPEKIQSLMMTGHADQYGDDL